MSEPRPPARPLARRLWLVLFATGALCIAVAVGVFYTLWAEQAMTLRRSELERQTAVVASGVAVGDILPGSEADTGGVRARLLKVEAGLIGSRLAVTDGAGTVLFTTGGAAGVGAYPVSRLVSSGGDFSARSSVQDMEGIGPVAVVAVPVSFDGPGRPARYLVAARPLADLRAADSYAIAAIALAALIALLVALVSGPWLAKRITRRLVRLTEGVRALEAGQFGRQVAVEGNDEVAVLASAFNDMSTRVADAYNSQQEFVGNVSHELRTPITSIRGFAEALDDGTLNDTEGVRHAAAIIRAEAGRLSDLTSTLLGLADLEAGAVQFGREPVDVAGIEETLRTRFGVEAERRGLTLTIETGSASPVADRERLLQAVSAIVDNALRHAPGVRNVRVRSSSASGIWRLEVEDDGRGIASDDRERIFHRFTRLDTSRSTTSGGSGLGLAICRRIVELMGGRVWADTSPELGGARFTLELPCG